MNITYESMWQMNARSRIKLTASWLGGTWDAALQATSLPFEQLEQRGHSGPEFHEGLHQVAERSSVRDSNRPNFEGKRSGQGVMAEPQANYSLGTGGVDGLQIMSLTVVFALEVTGSSPGDCPEVSASSQPPPRPHALTPLGSSPAIFLVRTLKAPR